MGLELGREVGGVIPSLKTCGHAKRTGGISSGIQGGRQVGRSELIHVYIMLNRHALRWPVRNVKQPTSCRHKYITNDQPTARHVDRRGGRVTDHQAVRHTAHTKSQKVRPKVWKGRPPVAISSRFGSTGARVKWVYYVNPPHVQPKFLTLWYDYRDTQHDTDRFECRF